MNMNFKRKLPIPKEIKEMYPISDEGALAKEKNDLEIAKVFTGESDKLVLVIGPCSADKEEAVIEYIDRGVQILSARHFLYPDSDGYFAVCILYSAVGTKGGKTMQLTSFLQDGRLTIVLTGEIDHHCAKDHIQCVSSKIEAYTPDVCILDFQDVTFMDSSGIAIVINALRNMTKIDGKLVVDGIGAQPMKVFRASGIEKLVEIKEAVS
jgi:anti-anti-sigma factor